MRLGVACFLVAWLVLVGGCDAGERGAGSGDTELGMPMNPDMPSYGCETDGDTDTDGCDGATTDASTTTGEDPLPENADACLSSSDCEGGSCVAVPEIPTDEGPPRLSRGPFACEFTCVAELDDARWCADDASCCDASARCTARGYCVVQ